MAVRTRYVPANSMADIARTNRLLAEAGLPPTSSKSMAEFLLSDQLAEPVDRAAADIADAARALAHAEIHSDSSSGAYEASIDSGPTEPVVINGNPRVAAVVHAHGGTESYGGFTSPESSHAAVVEFGNPAAPHSGRRILGRAGAPWHTEKRPR